LRSVLQNIKIQLFSERHRCITTESINKSISFMDKFIDNTIVGVFLDGKNLIAGIVKNNQLVRSVNKRINNFGSEEEILTELISTIAEVFEDDVVGIGVGVPSLVDTSRGIVYKVQNIQSWREVYLKDILESHFNVEVYINNDANSFAIGEKYFGKAKDYENVVGLILSEGVGAGIIFKGHLYSGTNCGAGEVGSLPYKDNDYEYYCSLGYFEEKYGMKFELVLRRALKKDKIALAIFEQYGYNLGNLIKAILFTVDPEIIVVGGIISKAFPYFEKSMSEVVRTFPYKHTLKKLVITASNQSEISVLGSAALYYDARNLTLSK